MRLFIALNIPADVRSEIFAATAPLREIEAAIGWTAPERLHLTVKFIGEGDDAAVTALAGAVTKVAARHRMLSLDISGVGAFPTLRRPRVVWAGVRPDPRLELLHHDIEEATHGRGFELDGRPFRPHITLGRVRTALDAESKRALAAAARRVRLRAAGPVHSIDLMESAAERGARVYRVLTSAPLNTR